MTSSHPEVSPEKHASCASKIASGGKTAIPDPTIKGSTAPSKASAGRRETGSAVWRLVAKASTPPSATIRSGHNCAPAGAEIDSSRVSNEAPPSPETRTTTVWVPARAPGAVPTRYSRSPDAARPRSEERRVGKECRDRRTQEQTKDKERG